MSWALALAMAVAAAALVALSACGNSQLEGTTARSATSRGHPSAGEQKTFRAPGMAIRFKFPPAFALKVARSERVAGNTSRASQAAVGVGRYDLLIVSRFPKRPIPVTASNLQRLRPQFDRAVSAALGHTVTSTVTTVGGLPALAYPPAPVSGLPVDAASRITEVFVGDDEYELNCQYTPRGAARVQAACDEMLATLSVTS